VQTFIEFQWISAPDSNLDTSPTVRAGLGLVANNSSLSIGDQQRFDFGAKFGVDSAFARKKFLLLIRGQLKSDLADAAISFQRSWSTRDSYMILPDRVRYTAKLACLASSASRCSLIGKPPPYPVSLPLDPITR